MQDCWKTTKLLQIQISKMKILGISCNLKKTTTTIILLIIIKLKYHSTNKFKYSNKYLLYYSFYLICFEATFLKILYFILVFPIFYDLIEFFSLLRSIHFYLVYLYIWFKYIFAKNSFKWNQFNINKKRSSRGVAFKN